MERSEKHSRTAIALAFATVYIVWGSTYLAIRFAIQTIPPLTMAGIRFVIAGSILLVYSLITRAPKPTAKQWRNGAVVGILMLTCGNGGVTWAEMRLPSGLAAIMVATVSLWLLLLNWAFGNKKRPTASQAAGLAIGLFGLVLLVMPSGQGLLGKGADLVGAGVILVGTLGWASGTLFARHAELPQSPWMTNGAEMLCGGIALLLVGALGGERVHWEQVSAHSLWSLAYLVVFGSIIAFSAYTWLNKATTAARLGTYAYVNPAVAVVLGAIFAGEPITARSIVAMLLILSGVVMLSVVRKPREAFVETVITPSAEPCPVAAE